VSIFLGSAAPTTYKLGATAVSKLYLGATQVWPTGVATFAITQQPKNNFSATYNQNAAFSVTATGIGALSYQWQGYYYDYCTGNYGWNDLSGATSSTFSLSGNTAYNYCIDSYSTGGMMQLRVVVTDAFDSATLTSQIVRWIDYSMVSPYADFYGNNGSYPSGTTSVGGVTYSNMPLQEDESVYLNVYDYGYTYFDTSWYSSNAFTVKLQSSLNATTWTDVETFDYRGSGFYINTTIAAQYGVIYYRVLVIANWPFTATNGTTSASRTALQITAASYKLTWPPLTSKIFATYLGLDAMTTQRETNIVDTYLGVDVMTTQNVTNIVDTYLGMDVMATQNSTNIVDTYLGVDVLCIVGSTLREPLNLAVTAGDGEIAATWSAPGYDGGSSITDYTVQYSDDAGATWTTFSDGVSTTRAVTVTGLANGSTYKIRVAAVNADGTGPYVTSGSYALVALPVITQQPKNDYATTGTQQVTFSVTATIAAGDLTYQWQYYGADYNNGDYDYRWRNISGATAASYEATGNIMSNLLSYDFYYTGTAQLRCAISASGGGAPKYTAAVRFMQLDNLHYPYPNWYGTAGTSQDWGGSFYTMSPQAGENVGVYVYDYAMSSPDTSWYTGNDTTIKIQVATTGATASADWTDLHTVESRGSIYLPNYDITPSTGVKYYRVIAVNKWPYAVNNGTSSATHATQYVYPYDSSSVLRVTWPNTFTPTAVLLTSGTSYTVPAGATSMKAWAVGGGGPGGAWSNSAAGAGGCAFKTWAVSGATVSYVAGAAGGNSTVTYSGTTITGNGCTSGLGLTGGSFSGGDGGAQGGAGESFGDGDASGGAVGGNGTKQSCGRKIATDVSGLLAAVALAGGKATEDCGSTAAFGSGSATGKYRPGKTAGYGGGGANPSYGATAGAGAVVLYFT
jgi:hypothetical protein